MRKMLFAAVGSACCALFSAPAVADRVGFADFLGAWGMQSSAGTSNEWQMNCDRDGNVLVLTPDRIYTRGAALVYKDYADCKVLNGSGGAALLIHATCQADGGEAENVMLEFAILSPDGPLRIQRQGEVSTEYHKCR